MTAKILDGKTTAKQIQQELTISIENRIAKGLPSPGLAVIMIGEHPASLLYVKKKITLAEQIGIAIKHHKLPQNTTEETLIDLITSLNKDPTVNGILVQLPLPKHINADFVLEKIDPYKDVDGLHPYNIGRLTKQQPLLRPCTSLGIMTLIQRNINIDFSKLNAVVIGRSNLVGLPMALELLAANATVAVCHKTTQDLRPYLNDADLVISAAGVPNLIKGQWIKKGAIVIDVGINHLANGKIVGDVEFAVAQERASWITPVPGGVGPMTVVTLMVNTLLATQLHENSK